MALDGPSSWRFHLSRIMQASASPSSTSTPAATNQLIESLDALLAAKQSGAPQEEIESLISTVKQLSSQAGADRVIPELNDGVFKGFTLTGRMTKLLGGDSTITMQVSGPPNVWMRLLLPDPP